MRRASLAAKLKLVRELVALRVSAVVASSHCHRSRRTPVCTCKGPPKVGPSHGASGAGHVR